MVGGRSKFDSNKPSSTTFFTHAKPIKLRGLHLRKNVMDEPAHLIIKDMSEKIELIPGNSLITNTPEEGRMLAIKISRLIIKATQPDASVRERLRTTYAEDPQMLISIGQTVSIEFATIAKANNYWR